MIETGSVLFYSLKYTLSAPPTPPPDPDSCGRGLKAKQTPRNVVVIQYPEESNQLYKIDNSFQFDGLDRVMLTAKRSENLFPDAVSLLEPVRRKFGKFLAMDQTSRNVAILQAHIPQQYV